MFYFFNGRETFPSLVSGGLMYHKLISAQIIVNISRANTFWFGEFHEQTTLTGHR